MRTTLTVVIFVFVSAGSFGQGTVRFDNNVPGALLTHVYLPRDPSGFYQSGNGPNDYPPGTNNWTGWTPVSGSGYSAQIWAAPGNAPEAVLQPATPITTFRRGSEAGFFAGVTATLSGVPADALWQPSPSEFGITRRGR